MHGNEIAVENAGIAHAHTLHAQQEVRFLLEQAGIDLVARLDMLLGQDRRPGRDPPDERQAELVAQRILEPDAARGAREELDGPLALERAQVILGRIDRAETELPGNFVLR
jgi:hypothetical protein